MVLVCAWCGNTIPPALPATEQSTDQRVTHGICNECLERELAEDGAQQEQRKLEPLDPRD